MNKALKRELAALGGILALTVGRSHPRFRGALALASLGLWVSSFRKDFQLQGKRVYLTGGSRGLGLALARELLRRGARAVTLVARDSDELAKARDILAREFPSGIVHLSVCDVTETDALCASLEKSTRDMGGIDLLVNNAGSILVGPFSTMEREDFEAQMRLHLYAVVEATQWITPYFQSRGGGRVLNICSLGGKAAIPHMLPYDASKFALSGFSQGVAAELAPLGIRITTAYPTVMRTGSPIQAVFKGEHEKEFQWFGTIDNLPGLSTSAEAAAGKILDGVEDGRSEVVFSLPAKVRMWAGVIFPELVQAVMGLAARWLPNGSSTRRQTGAESSRAMDRSAFLGPLREYAKKIEKKYNQEPRHDAEFNLGLKTTPSMKA